MSLTLELEPMTYAQSNESDDSAGSFVLRKKETKTKKDKPLPLPPLRVTIPPAQLTPHSSAGSSSSSSSSSPSPSTGILSPKQSHSQLHGHLSVTFAPLPQLEKRKRRSMVPLGIAARGQMVSSSSGSSRRGGGGYHHQPSSPMWTEEEEEEQMRRYGDGYVEEGMEGVEDPFLVLGRMVKGAGKRIWRRVSGGNHGKKGRKEGRGDEQVGEEQGEVVDGDGDENDSVSLTVDQTETIVEGTVRLSWIKPEEVESASPTATASERPSS